jgi:hypothetical protein
VTAEFAAALPAALLCLGLCLGAVQAVAQQSRLVGEAANGARLLGRGEVLPGSAATGPAGEEAAAAGGERGVEREVDREGGMVCVTLSAPSEAAGLGRLGVTVTARQCAIDEEAVGGVAAG